MNLLKSLFFSLTVASVAFVGTFRAARYLSKYGLKYEFFDKDDVWLDGGRFCGGCVAFGLCL